MTRIFISYRREDSAYVAGILSKKIQDHFGKDSIFMDVDDIPFGVDFRKHISNAVEKCGILLALIGDLWINVRDKDGRRRIDNPTDFVRLEIDTALSRNIPVVPVLVGNALMPKENELPDPLKPLAYRNAAEIRSGRDLWHHIETLIRGIESQIQTETSEIPIQPDNVQHKAQPTAEEWYRKGIALWSESSHEYHNPNLAIEYFSEAARLDPVNANTYHSRGIANRQIHAFTAAVEDFSRAISIYPDDAEYYNDRGAVYWAMQQIDKAKTDFKKACTMGSKHGCDNLAKYFR